jgi:colanic acid/amylovoran biosynthesis glycosyltransferase
VQWVKGLDEWMWVQAFGIKLVLSLRGAHINYSPIADTKLAAMYRENFPKVDGFHAVSKAIAKESLKYHSRDDKIQVIYSGLDLDTLVFQRKESISKDGLKILSVGRAHWKKGYRYALDAMTVLKEIGVDFHYSIIGVKHDEALLYQRHEAGLNDCVTFLDTLSFEEVKAQITSADVLLLPSIKEGIANVVLEAMALGTLVISTDCGGMNEVVTNNESGFLVPIRDVAAMVDSLMNVYKMPIDTYQSITKKARKVVEDHHTDEQMISSFVNLYNNLERLN